MTQAGNETGSTRGEVRVFAQYDRDFTEEFDEYAWVASGQFAEYELDEFTSATVALGGIGVEE